MNGADIASRRLHTQRIAGPGFEHAAGVVRWLGAVQAQEYRGSLWAIGLRTPAANERDIEEAIAARQIVRTWPMRGTIHYVAPEDARWMLRLLTPRVIARSAGRYRQLELEEADFARARDLLIAALQGGKRLTRPQLYDVLQRGGLATEGQRSYHVIIHLAQEALICFGPHAGRQPTFVLLDEWIAPAPEPERDEALAMLATRYFTGHGPATVQDFAWWSGLTVTDARHALDLAAPGLEHVTIDGVDYWSAGDTPPARDIKGEAHLLPPYDEYLVGYRDRSAAGADGVHDEPVVPRGNVLGSYTLLIGGRVAGIWRRTIRRGSVVIELQPFAPLSASQEEAVSIALRRYSDFLGLPAGIA